MQHKTRHYKPLPDCVTIRKSKLHGLGVFATKDIPADYDFGITHVNDDRFPDGLIRTPVGGFINYSHQPNCVFIETKDGWELKTLGQIKAGEELTADYPIFDEAVLATYN
jgi:SET domain-containing protein